MDDFWTNECDKNGPTYYDKKKKKKLRKGEQILRTRNSLTGLHACIC